MDTVFGLAPLFFAIAATVALAAGFVKGVVGFAMPIIFISGLSTVVAPETALAAMIIPTLLTNSYQAMQNGIVAAWRSLRVYCFFVVCTLFMLIASAQVFPYIPINLLLLGIGTFVSLFSALQLIGYRWTLTERSLRTDAIVGCISGISGGLTGSYAAPIVLYLTALGTNKVEQLRVQGVIYALCSVALLGAHLKSGILNASTIPLSVALVVPAIAGMWLGTRFSKHTDQAQFRNVTLGVLLVVGLNLIRKAMMS